MSNCSFRPEPAAPSNTGYILLGLLIEKISNRAYARYLEDDLLRWNGPCTWTNS